MYYMTTYSTVMLLLVLNWTIQNRFIITVIIITTITITIIVTHTSHLPPPPCHPPSSPPPPSSSPLPLHSPLLPGNRTLGDTAFLALEILLWQNGIQWHTGHRFPWIPPDSLHPVPVYTYNERIFHPLLTISFPIPRPEKNWFDC